MYNAGVAGDPGVLSSCAALGSPEQSRVFRISCELLQWEGRQPSGQPTRELLTWLYIASYTASGLAGSQ